MPENAGPISEKPIPENPIPGNRRPDGWRPGIIEYAAAPRIERGDGIVSVELTPQPLGDQGYIMGTTTFPEGSGLALHCHNTVEQVMLLSGVAMAEIDGEQHQARPYDTTQVSAGVWHRWVNVGEGPMAILWVYGAVHVTRTLFASGITVDQFGRGQSEACQNEPGQSEDGQT